jgi:hypothetical protein
MSKFCLLMIVRDEASVITRALESVSNIITSYYIMDTGSKDNTIEIIRNWMMSRLIPGEVCEHPWKNFGYNKSLLLKNAKEHFNYFISGSENWIWLDADEVFVMDPKNPLSYPSKEDSERLYNHIRLAPSSVFKLFTHFGSLQYVRPQIAKNTQLYKWEQPVHEYFVGTVDNSIEVISWMYNLARKEGNSSRNPDRYKHDAEMFLEFLKEQPNEPRAVFYLAQTYESFDDSKAQEWYRKRIDITSGYYQERYIACLRLAKKVREEKDKVQLLLKAIEIDSRRLEAYYELLMMEYSRGNYRKGAGWGIMAPMSREINSDFLFSEHSVYNYMFDLNFGVCCYYTGLYEIGLQVTKSAIPRASENSHILGLLQQNAMFLEQKIPVKNQPPRQEIIIIDNFYEDPMKVREDALNLEYDVKGNYPGVRTKPVFYGDMRKKFEDIIGRSIKYWPTDSYNGSFQYTTENMNSWIHRDLTEWSAIVYLSPVAPKNGGTKFYSYKPTGKMYAQDKDEESQMSNDTYNEDKWELVDTIGNIFNRCVLFRGKRTHISDKYFGNDLETGRLFQTFFFDD